MENRDQAPRFGQIGRTQSGLDALRELAAKVRRPPCVFAWSFGTGGAIAMAAGPVMTAMPLGAVIGAAGLVMALANYPIYRAWLAGRRKKYAHALLALHEYLTRDTQ